ncbi:MAG: 4-alpha-glucanotransferase [Sulfurifustis sp.]
MKTLFDQRRAGVLLHPTSFPRGTFGADGMRFLGFMQAAGLSVWQTLPIGPTHADGSPYHSLSVNAIGPHLIDLEALVQKGWLAQAPAGTDAAARRAAIAQAYAAFAQCASAEDRAAFDGFYERERSWLREYALYQALREEHDRRAWWEWPRELRDRDRSALSAAGNRLTASLKTIYFEQFIASSQWQELRREARRRDILLFGDMPIFVAHDSAEVWARRAAFKLDENGQPRVVAGVPPDYFSETGQRWGNPIYDWDYLQTHGFDFWLARLATEFARFDIVRVDHFRGFEACWEIPAADDTAVNGRWVKVPGAQLFEALLARFERLPLVAEDLGLITPEVIALRRRYGLPGMTVLQFAFDGGPTNPYLPHNVEIDQVVYTGTHDNDTTLGWFEGLRPDQQNRVREYLGSGEPMPWLLIRVALMSVGRVAIVPLQDYLGLGRAHRMNMPGTSRGNWSWRFDWSMIPSDLAGRVRHLVEMYGRGEKKKE